MSADEDRIAVALVTTRIRAVVRQHEQYLRAKRSRSVTISRSDMTELLRSIIALCDFVEQLSDDAEKSA